jgi:hypothetical protein
VPQLQFTLVEFTDNLERNLNGIEHPSLKDIDTYVLPLQLGLKQLLKASTGQHAPETYDHDEQLVLPFELLDHPGPLTHDQVTTGQFAADLSGSIVFWCPKLTIDI